MKVAIILIILAIAGILMGTTVLPTAFVFMTVSLLSTILIGALVVLILKDETIDAADSMMDLDGY